VAGASLFFKMGLANRTTPERKAAGKDIASLPTRRLERRLGMLPKEAMEQIKTALRFALDL
jgi:mRNA-degrading endonuclease toxin of MazEF toxin-antitoxin module